MKEEHEQAQAPLMQRGQRALLLLLSSMHEELSDRANCPGEAQGHRPEVKPVQVLYYLSIKRGELRPRIISIPQRY